MSESSGFQACLNFISGGQLNGQTATFTGSTQKETTTSKLSFLFTCHFFLPVSSASLLNVVCGDDDSGRQVWRAAEQFGKVEFFSQNN